MGTLYCHKCFNSYHPMTRLDRQWEGHWQEGGLMELEEGGKVVGVEGAGGVWGSLRIPVAPAPTNSPYALTQGHVDAMVKAYEESAAAAAAAAAAAGVAAGDSSSSPSSLFSGRRLFGEGSGEGGGGDMSFSVPGLSLDITSSQRAM